MHAQSRRKYTDFNSVSTYYKDLVTYRRWMVIFRVTYSCFDRTHWSILKENLCFVTSVHYFVSLSMINRTWRVGQDLVSPIQRDSRFSRRFLWQNKVCQQLWPSHGEQSNSLNSSWTSIEFQFYLQFLHTVWKVLGLSGSWSAERYTCSQDFLGSSLCTKNDRHGILILFMFHTLCKYASNIQNILLHNLQITVYLILWSSMCRIWYNL